MIPIKVKDETGKELTIDANSVLCVCENKSTNTGVRSLILFKGQHFGYLFSCENHDVITERIKKAKSDERIASEIISALTREDLNDLTTY